MTSSTSSPRKPRFGPHESTKALLRRVAFLVADGMTVAQAAREVGCRPNAVYKYRRRKSGRAVWDAAYQEAVNRIGGPGDSMHHPSPATAAEIRQVVRIVASGNTMVYAAEVLGLKTKRVHELHTRWWKFWDNELAAAKAELEALGVVPARRPGGKVLSRIKNLVEITVTGESVAEAARMLGYSERVAHSYWERHLELCKQLEALAKSKFDALVKKNLAPNGGSPHDTWAGKLLALRQQQAKQNGRLATEQPARRRELSADMTLREFFEVYVWPMCLRPKGNATRTRADYLSSLRRWAALSGDPPLDKITKETLAEFAGLVREQDLSENTIFKHVTTIQRLVDWTGPPSRSNRNGAGLVEAPAWIPAPRKQFNLPRRPFTLDEIARWLAVLPQTARPMPKLKGFSPATWWRAVILVAYNTGMRPGTLFQIWWEMLDGHVLRIPPSVIKGRHGRLVWLNDPALEAIEPLRRPSGLVFRWADWPAGETTLKKHRYRQQRAAGVADLSLYGLRRTFATECGKINPMAMQIMLGHMGAGLQMAADHYVCAESLLADALAKLPQPEPISLRRAGQ
ncbi:MAG: hypothetical protein A2V70_03510 [Planctomycetes bacterium RBG_13_63_9]|nr:MAG: hypothetical protein A2V70_03510 [Planctomycetes bacterium RBG_13_63_9]